MGWRSRRVTVQLCWTLARGSKEFEADYENLERFFVVSLHCSFLAELLRRSTVVRQGSIPGRDVAFRSCKHRSLLRGADITPKLR